MTKAFLEKISLKPENEKLVLEAFSKKSLKKVKEYNCIKRIRLKKKTDSQ